MKIITYRVEKQEFVGIQISQVLVPLDEINRKLGTNWRTEMRALLESGSLEDLQVWYHGDGRQQVESLQEFGIPVEEADLTPLYRKPPKIWGIGLNYREHAADLSEMAPVTEPASFMKPYTTLIGYQETIQIPAQSQRTTAEAELGIIIGKECRHVERERWLDVVAGFTTIIDMTAEDILRRNPRYLTLSKSFDTFFSFGSCLLTPDEIPDVMDVYVSTVINGQVHASNVVANMTFPPDFLVSFHSDVMTLLPGDIISTGTPGATMIADGDIVECRIDGFPPQVNPVRDLKVVRSLH